MSASPRLSIVVPTYNRRARLERVLRGLERQTVSPDLFEVVIIDDGSTDDTKPWLEANRARAYAVTVVTQQNAGPSRARNRGGCQA